MSPNLTATYRLQLHAGFTFADAAAQTGYLRSLGVSHLYLSPILTAVEGSMHGYDVVDHTRINDELGGIAGFEELVQAAHADGLGIVVDVVPNHMAFVAPEYRNRPVWELLRNGRDAPTVDWFDVDWKAGGGRIGLPILGSTLPEAIEAGEITRDELDGEPVLRYFEHVFPLALGSEHIEDLAALLDRQHYRLASWREKDEVLNYRRFFEVDGLIAVRVELQEVFDATHELLLDLHHRGLIDGFRIDHPDGLADPAEYLERLTRACRNGTPIWVEKILEGPERLPRSWQCAGTTGYDALRVVQSALTDPASADVIEREWEATGGDADFEEEVRAAKRQVVAQSLAPEVERLTRRAREALPDLEGELLRDAIIELLVAGEVYRAYVRPEHRMSRTAQVRLAEAFGRAMEARPDLSSTLEALVPMTVLADEDDEAATDFAVRLQQTWGPVMAKGIEDTTFYRWHRLIALNEVGSDPTVLRNASPQSLHDWSQWQQEHWPLTMTALSTHDTKRSEDTRARILAVAGDPQAWEQLSRVTRELAADAGVDLPTAHLVWQTLLGVGEISPERLSEYLQKALREAKEHTAWVDGDEDYERRIIDFAICATQGGPLYDALHDALENNRYAVRALTLGAKLLQLTIPGVPDTYQGCEGIDLSLVDPDNRRPVDYAVRAVTLANGSGPQLDGLSAEKLQLVMTVLAAREREPAAFGADSSYTPVESTSEHVVGFVRAHAPGRVSGVFNRGRRATFASLVLRAPSRWEATGGFTDETVALDSGSWTDLLTGRSFDVDEQIHASELFADEPVVFLEEVG
ncbi:malto-oligosyltrehalose synthase [Dermatophilaceae bacterium Sec6.4]